MRDQVKQARASLRQFIPIIRYELLTKLRQMLEFSVWCTKIDAQLPKFSILALGSFLSQPIQEIQPSQYVEDPTTPK